MKKIFYFALVLISNINAQEAKLRSSDSSFQYQGPPLSWNFGKTNLSEYLDSSFLFFSTNELSISMSRNYLARKDRDYLPSSSAIRAMEDLFKDSFRSAFASWADQETKAIYIKERLQDSVWESVRIGFLKMIGRSKSVSLSEPQTDPRKWTDGLELGANPIHLTRPSKYIGYGWLDSDDNPILYTRFELIGYDWNEIGFGFANQIPIYKKWQFGIGLEWRPFLSGEKRARQERDSRENNHLFLANLGIDGPFAYRGKVYARYDPVHKTGMVAFSIPL